MEWWNNFCDFWVRLWNKITTWFSTSDTDGLTPINRLIIAICLIVVGRILIKLFMKLMKKIFGVNKKLGVDVSVKTFSLSVINVILNLALAIFVLLILKVDFTSVSSILSAGTVAIGLSLQDLISAFASGVVLLKSKRFKTGDYIEVVHSDGKCEGIVSSVGLITTTVDTYDNQKVIIPNNKLQQGVITNYSTNPTRRCVIPIKVDIDSDLEKCKMWMMVCAQKDERILADPLPSVVISEVDEKSITVTIRVFTKLKDYWDVYFALRENILLTFRDKGIRLPYQRVTFNQDEKRK